MVQSSEEEEEETPQKRVKHIFEIMDTVRCLLVSVCKLSHTQLLQDQDGRLSREEFLEGGKSDPSIAKSLSIFEDLI